MANIALLVPNDELFRLTHDVLQEMKKSLFYMKVIETEDAVTEARQVISAGADIIIARGLQATMIKQYTDIPVVEIVATRSGISSILEHGKRIVRKKIPEIAIVMFRNMACDMTGLGDACGVHLREYLIQNPELLKTTARQAVEDKADLIIGGETVCSVADRAGVPSLFLTNTEDAVRSAVVEAFRLGEAFDGEQRDSEKTIGKKKALSPEKEAVTASFVNFPYHSAAMQSTVDLAEKLSFGECPKLLSETDGTLYRAFANAIHNHSKHSREKLVSFDCVPGVSSYEALYGKNGKLQEASKGTLEINFVENLDAASQQRLPEVMLFHHVVFVTRKRELRDVLVPELYARVSPFMIRIPSLEETKEDVSYLSELYLRSICEKYGKFLALTKEDLRVLEGFHWSFGRVQLESFIERLVLTTEHRTIKAEEIRDLYTQLYPEMKVQVPDVSIGRGQEWTEKAVERDRILAALSETMGNREKTAEKLGISRATLWRKIKEYGI